ncbi:MAG: hypothetical protein ACXQTI_02095 [Candidatus Nezhaarchaeales archaeon]
MREMLWNELKGLWSRRREILAMSLRMERIRHRPRSIEDSLKLALLAERSFKMLFEVRKSCQERELIMRM